MLSIFARRSLPLLLLLLNSILLIAQPFASDSNTRPRSKMDFDKPGHYELVAQTKGTELNPGQSLDIDIYISGYGEIKGSKIFYAASQDIFDTTSYAIMDLNPDGDKLSWGKNTFYLKGQASRFSIGLTGYANKKYPDWSTPTQYIDADHDSLNLLILTEKWIKYAPLQLHLNTKKNAEGGSYSVTIVYTYFNGQQWSGATQQINFKVNNWLEQNQFPIWVIGISLALVAIIPIISNFVIWCIKIFRKKSKTPIISSPPLKSNPNSSIPSKAKKSNR